MGREPLRHIALRITRQRFLCLALNPTGPHVPDMSTLKPSGPHVPGTSTLNPTGPHVPGTSTLNPTGPHVPDMNTLKPTGPHVPGMSTLNPTEPHVPGMSTLNPTGPGMRPGPHVPGILINPAGPYGVNPLYVGPYTWCKHPVCFKPANLLWHVSGVLVKLLKNYVTNVSRLGFSSMVSICW